MKQTTLCYIEKDNQYLMMHRTKKQNDPNEGKWIGVGGKIEQGETPDQCLLREVMEETGLALQNFRLRGHILFQSDEWEDEFMYLYTSSDYTGVIRECDEGDLAWVVKDTITGLNLWEGDRIFMELLARNVNFFTLTLRYQGEKLVDHFYMCE